MPQFYDPSAYTYNEYSRPNISQFESLKIRRLSCSMLFGNGDLQFLKARNDRSATVSILSNGCTTILCLCRDFVQCHKTPLRLGHETNSRTDQLGRPATLIQD